MVAVAPIARGDIHFAPAAMRSPLAGVPDRAWTAFVAAMRVQDLGAVTASGALGMFAFRIPRLADLGIVTGAKCGRRGGRHSWRGTFVRPLTAQAFLRRPLLQYNAFVESMKRFAAQIAVGEIKRPAGMSMSGALAVLHCAGPRALAEWDPNDMRFPHTRDVYGRAQGSF